MEERRKGLPQVNWWQSYSLLLWFIRVARTWKQRCWPWCDRQTSHQGLYRGKTLVCTRLPGWGKVGNERQILLPSQASCLVPPEQMAPCMANGLGPLFSTKSSHRGTASLWRLWSKSKQTDCLPFMQRGGQVMYILLFSKWVTTGTYWIAQGTLLTVMWQLGWKGSLGENGYMWVPLLFT